MDSARQIKTTWGVAIVKTLEADEKGLNTLILTTTVMLMGRYPTCAFASAVNLGVASEGGARDTSRNVQLLI